MNFEKSISSEKNLVYRLNHTDSPKFWISKKKFSSLSADKMKSPIVFRRFNPYPWIFETLWIFFRKTRSVTVPQFWIFPGFTDKGPANFQAQIISQDYQNHSKRYRIRTGFCLSFQIFVLWKWVIFKWAIIMIKLSIFLLFWFRPSKFSFEWKRDWI